MGSRHKILLRVTNWIFHPSKRSVRMWARRQYDTWTAEASKTSQAADNKKADPKEKKQEDGSKSSQGQSRDPRRAKQLTIRRLILKRRSKRTAVKVPRDNLVMTLNVISFDPLL